MTRQHQSETLSPTYNRCIHVGGDIEQARDYATRAEDALLKNDSNAFRFGGDAEVRLHNRRGAAQLTTENIGSVNPRLSRSCQTKHMLADVTPRLPDDALRPAVEVGTKLATDGIYADGPMQPLVNEVTEAAAVLECSS